ncbi:MAG: hypothetical protein MUC88_15650 [Planctomycetes bacterium]|nr:hypothetical protein [Planctomycetota bacterium]
MIGKEGTEMKHVVVSVALVVVVALGSYALWAQPGSMPQGGNDDVMGGMGAGMMGNMSCSAGGMMPPALAATSDGGVVVAAGGKLVKYDALLKKVAEAQLDIDADAMQKGMPADCPMSQMMK